MATFRSYPKHLKPIEGRGLIECAMTGFLRKPDDIVEIDGQPIAKDFADHYDGFGYTHPQDVAQPEVGGDPRSVEYGGLSEGKSLTELGISDQEMQAAIREDRPPRRGF